MPLGLLSPSFSWRWNKPSLQKGHTDCNRPLLSMGQAKEAVPAWYEEPCMLGIDEAGRGPVLGPMVYGSAFCPISQKDHIATLEFADSKTLSETKREELFESIKANHSLGWAVDVISPQDLSAQMLRVEKKSLNAISFDSAFGLIQQALDRGVYLKEVYVDTVGDSEQYEARLSQKFPGITFTVRKKADSLFPIVSAASIVAKVTRDRNLRGWEGNGPVVGRAFGSGYPGDPDTKAWLLQHREAVFAFPELVRFSWSTCRPLIDDACAAVFWEGEEEDENAAPGSKRRRTAKVQFESSGGQRPSFFRARQLQVVTTKL